MILYCVQRLCYDFILCPKSMLWFYIVSKDYAMILYYFLLFSYCVNICRYLFCMAINYVLSDYCINYNDNTRCYHCVVERSDGICISTHCFFCNKLHLQIISIKASNHSPIVVYNIVLCLAIHFIPAVSCVFQLFSYLRRAFHHTHETAVV